MGEKKPETTDHLVSQIIDCAAELHGRFGVRTAAGIFVRQILFYSELLADQVERTGRKDAA